MFQYKSQLQEHETQLKMEGDSFEKHVDLLLGMKQKQTSSKSDIKLDEVDLFSETGVKLSPEEVLLEFMEFMRKLPILIKSEKDRLVNLVKEELQVDKIVLSKLDFRKLSSLESGNHVISQLSRKIGQSLNILAPPITRCLLCRENLTMNNPPSQIVVHGMNGPEVYSKYILRCRMCKLDHKSKTQDKKLKQDVYYHPER